MISHKVTQAERRLYTLRDQLKIQFRATQKAQVNERKAADSKRRLTSYVFHEVRVPLNTALLAVQNMEASGAVAKTQEIEFKALEGSLSMMSKVLNDVLDFNRMDSGRFESVLKVRSVRYCGRSL
jgi:osomolarity two-component system, sensor histidine kinase SLN1